MTFATRVCERPTLEVVIRRTAQMGAKTVKSIYVSGVDNLNVVSVEFMDARPCLLRYSLKVRLKYNDWCVRGGNCSRLGRLRSPASEGYSLFGSASARATNRKSCPVEARENLPQRLHGTSPDRHRCNLVSLRITSRFDPPVSTSRRSPQERCPTVSFPGPEPCRRRVCSLQARIKPFVFPEPMAPKVTIPVWNHFSGMFNHRGCSAGAGSSW
jgi:hypothetical protein